MSQDRGVGEPHSGAPAGRPGEQSGPALAMHATDDGERLDGLLAQLRADLPGESPAAIEQAVRRRIDEIGLTLDEPTIDRIVADLVSRA